jgi:DNA topoisomerase IA
LTVYEETLDEDAAPDASEGVILPELSEGEAVDLIKLLPEQHFTQPPRYTEATLVKTLEEYGIGRPALTRQSFRPSSSVAMSKRRTSGSTQPSWARSSTSYW